MEHDEDLVEHPAGDGLGLRVEIALHQFDVPVAELVPHEVVDGVRRRIEAQVGHGLVEFGQRLDDFADDPLVDRTLRYDAGTGRIADAARNAIALAEAGGVPQLGGEVAVPLDALLIHLHVAALAFHGGHEEAQRIGAVLVDEAQRIDDVALGLGHLRPVRRAHEAMQVEPLPRHFLHEVQPLHRHACIPEEQDVEAGDQQVVGVVLLEQRRLLVRPPERGERPERGGEPGVEDVLVAPDSYTAIITRAFVSAFMPISVFVSSFRALVDAHLVVISAVIFSERSLGFFFSVRDDTMEVFSRKRSNADRVSGIALFEPIPSRNPVSPPELAADTPRLDVLHPVEERLFPRLGDDLDRARAHRLDRRLRELFGIDVPLVGQPGLDHHAAAVAVGRLDRARLCVVLVRVAFLVPGDVRDEQAEFLHLGHDHLARRKTLDAKELFGDQAVGGLADVRIGIEHVEHLGGLEPGALAYFEVVEVMPRRDLHCTRTEFGIGVLVGDDGDLAAGDRQGDGGLAFQQRLVAVVVRVHRHGHVGQHRLGARGGDHDVARTVAERVLEVPEAALNLARFHFEVADRGLQARVPVYQPLVAVDQALIVEVDEDLHHRPGEVRVHGELLAAPVHRAAEAPQLAGNGAAALVLPLPDFLDELLARVVGALVLPFLHLALDDHLRGDAGMVGTHHPQRILAAQPLVADHHVLQRIVERVADVQAARHVRRRVDDGEGLRVGPLGMEQAVLFPVGVPLRLDLGGVESLVQCGVGRCVGHGAGLCQRAGLRARR